LDDFACANSLRGQVLAAGGAQRLTVRALRDWFGRERLTERSRSEIELALRRAGLEAEPSLLAARLEDVVVIRLADRSPGVAAPPPQVAVARGSGGWAWYRRLPVWAQLAAPIVVLVLIGAAAGGGSDGGDGGSGGEAQLAAGQPATTTDEPSAAEREARRERRRARERRHARARRRAAARRRAEARREAAARRRAAERRAERRRERERERERERQAAAAAPAESNCDPSYEGDCLDPNASDYDCAGGSGDGPEYADGPIQVVGDDHFDLDRDGDGAACE
jgi:hypothetical protein